MPMLPSPPQPRRIPDAVAAMLRSAREAERLAGGSERRAAFRLTRILLGGARAAGYSVGLLANCVGMSATAVRDRSGLDGWISVVELSTVSGVAVSQWLSWHDAGVLVERCHNTAGHDCFLASEAIRALGGHGRRPHLF